MNPAINKAQYLIRRELWENRGGVIWTPVVICVIVSVLLLGTLALGNVVLGQGVDVNEVFEWMDDHGLREDQDAPVQIVDFNSGTLVVSSDSEFSLGDFNQNVTPTASMTIMQHSVVIGFSFVALIVTVIYLLGALFNDRKDRSILFWKSLPISETANVVSKLVFAATVIPIVALLFSIPVQFFGGLTIAWTFSQSDSFGFGEVFGELSIIQVTLIHMILLLFIGIKSIPLFSWLLFSSAVSKKSPLLIAIVAPLLIIAVESLIFNTDYFSSFVTSLFFSNRFDVEWTEPGEAFHGAIALMSFSFMQIVKIVVAGGVLISAAVWCRNNRYEL